MKLNGLHLLLTYQCTFECDHCFVWGSPGQSGTMTLVQIRQILAQAKEAGSIEKIYFEGGEPFLFYPILLQGVREAAGMGFRVGIVSNAYWANDLDDSRLFLEPFADLLEDLTISSDLFHYSELTSLQARNAVQAAERSGVEVGTISIAQPEETDAGQGAVMYRGRAVQKLVPRAALRNWDLFTECPHEDLREPGRCHLDPLGNLHICQGIALGNVFEKSLKQICEVYQADAHPITGPLLAGGPVALAKTYELPHAEAYADACHLCYEMRLLLRERFPEILTPDQMYGTGN